MWSGVNATQSTTASNARPRSTARAPSRSRMSPCRRCAPSGARRMVVCPRLSRTNSCPRSIASCPHAELMTPVPPMKRSFMSGILPEAGGRLNWSLNGPASRLSLAVSRGILRGSRPSRSTVFPSDAPLQALAGSQHERSRRCVCYRLRGGFSLAQACSTPRAAPGKVGTLR